MPGPQTTGSAAFCMGSQRGFYLPDGFKDAAPYLVVLLMLAIKPNGLFRETLLKKV